MARLSFAKINKFKKIIYLLNIFFSKYVVYFKVVKRLIDHNSNITSNNTYRNISIIFLYLIYTFNISFFLLHSQNF